MLQNTGFVAGNVFHLLMMLLSVGLLCSAQGRPVMAGEAHNGRKSHLHRLNNGGGSINHPYVRVMTGLFQNGCHEYFILIIQYQ